MAFLLPRQLLDFGAEHAHGVPAFKIDNLEPIRVIVRTALPRAVRDGAAFRARFSRRTCFRR